MVPLGYGKFVRADRVFALVPIEDRGDGRRTFVHVEGLGEPIVSSRSERAILADVDTALGEASGLSRPQRLFGRTGADVGMSRTTTRAQRRAATAA
jgi:hypothetical protein